MLFIKSLQLLYHRVKISKHSLTVSIILFWIISVFNTISFIRGQDNPLQLLNVFLSFKSQEFISFIYLPFCFITTVIILHEKDNLFLLVRFREISYCLKVKVVQLFILTITWTLATMFILILNTWIYSVYSHSSLNISFYSSLLLFFYFASILCVNTLNLLLLQSVFYTILKNKLLGLVCIFLLVLIDPFLNIKTGRSLILYHGLVTNQISMTISELINQFTYCLGELFLLLVGFYYSFINKEFY